MKAHIAVNLPPLLEIILFYDWVRLGGSLIVWRGCTVLFEDVLETAGLYNTVGFNDDTRAYPSIPARHDVWRRASADYLASLLIRHIIDEEDAQEMVHAMAYGLAKSSYRIID